MKRDVKPDEFKYLQQDTQQAAIIEDLLRTKKIEEAGSTDKNKKQIAQHLADLRKRGVLQDVSSELGFFMKQSAKEVDHTAVPSLILHIYSLVLRACTVRMQHEERIRRLYT